jgi:hypothetical protein
MLTFRLGLLAPYIGTLIGLFQQVARIPSRNPFGSAAPN